MLKKGKAFGKRGLLGCFDVYKGLLCVGNKKLELERLSLAF